MQRIPARRRIASYAIAKRNAGSSTAPNNSLRNSRKQWLSCNVQLASARPGERGAQNAEGTRVDGSNPWAPYLPSVFVNAETIHADRAWILLR